MPNDRPDFNSMVEPLMQDDLPSSTPDFEERGTPQQVTALYAALATAQGEFGEIKKTAEVTVTMKSGGKYNFKYAPIEEMYAATKPALSKNGLVVLMPFMRSMSNATKQILIIAHKDGARLVFTFPFDPENDIKGFGGQTTYYQRYMYRSALSLAADADMDEIPETKRGEHSAESSTRPQQQRQSQQAQQQRPLDRQQSLPTNQQQTQQKPANAPQSSSASVENSSQESQSQSLPQESPGVVTQKIESVAGDSATKSQLIADVKASARTLGYATVRDLSNEIFGVLWNGEVRSLGEPFLSGLNVAELTKVLDVFTKRREAKVKS